MIRRACYDLFTRLGVFGGKGGRDLKGEGERALTKGTFVETNIKNFYDDFKNDHSAFIFT